MSLTRLFPRNTDVSGSDWTPFGASPAHVGLSDGSDGTGVNRQMSTFEPQRTVKGTSMTQLPATAGYIKQMTLGIRVSVDIANSAATTGRVLLGGSPVLSVSVGNVPDVITNFTNILGAPIPFATVNSLTWELFSTFNAHDGVQTIAYELWLDVEWYPVGGQNQFY